jgi:hypothetical protein
MMKMRMVWSFVSRLIHKFMSVLVILVAVLLNLTKWAISSKVSSV